MTNSKTKNNKPTGTRNSPLVLAAKNIKAREAALVEKKVAASDARGRGRGRGRNIVMDVNDENADATGPSKPNRRSSRLNGTTPGTAGEAPETDSNTHAEPVLETPNIPLAKRKARAMNATRDSVDNAGSYAHADDGMGGQGPSAKKSKGAKIAHVANTKAGRKTHTRPPTAENEDTELDISGGLDEIQELRRLLQQEKDKNRLLRRATATQTSHTAKAIPKPKGSIGAAGFSLIAEMKLDKHNPKDKVLYNDILASVRELAIGAGLDLGRRFKDQSITKLSKLMLAAREAEPYLARFEDDWATGQILRQYINGKQKYENAKANGKVNIGGKGGRTSASPSNDETERAGLAGNSDNSGCSSEDEEEWTGFDSTSHEVDAMFGESDNDDVDGA